MNTSPNPELEWSEFAAIVKNIIGAQIRNAATLNTIFKTVNVLEDLSLGMSAKTIATGKTYTKVKENCKSRGAAKPRKYPTGMQKIR